MRKTIYLIMSLVAAATITVACQKVGDSTQFAPDETLYRTGEVTLCVSTEDMTTKLAMDDLGHFLFASGDSIAAVCTDGTIFKLFLSGTGDTKRAFFKGTVPSGKTLGDIVFYPYSYLESYAHGVACIKLPSTQNYADDGFNCPLMGKLSDESYKVEMSQAAACLRLSIKNFPEDAKKVVFSDFDGNALSGDFDCDFSTNGIVTKKMEGDIEVMIENAPAKPQFSLCLPCGDYSDLAVTFYDKDGYLMSSQSISESPLTFERARLSSLEIESALIIKSYKFIIDDSQSIKLTETSSDHFEATFTAPASGECVFMAEGVELGFTSYSGAGGLGKCENKQSALPYYSYTEQHTQFYEVSKAIGALYPIEDGGNKLWLNLSAPATVKAVYDRSYGTHGSYYLEVVEEDDPSVIIDEGFDLFTCGGDQTWYLKGTKYEPEADSYDGLMAGAKAKSGWNATGGYNALWDYPTQTAASIVANETYIKNRGVDGGWVFQQVDERPGGIQLGQNSILGKLTTPAFSKLSGTSNVCFSIEMNRYGAGSSADIYLVIKDGGKFKSGHAHQTEATDIDGTHYDAIDADITGLDSDTYTVTTEYCMNHGSRFNTSPFKAVSTFDLNIEGATPNSRIEIYSASNSCRFIIYDIKVVKN